ncbi:helix-turn-helix domain-containing protein [bacterium]|nr:helix-turn-helix domain-containing protein [bacterium]
MKTPPHIKIKSIRKKKNFSQQYMAEKLGVSQFAYSKIERNETQLNWNKMLTIASALEINVWDLVDDTKSIDDSFEDDDSASKIVGLLDDLFDKFEKEKKELLNQIEELKEELMAKK